MREKNPPLSEAKKRAMRKYYHKNRERMNEERRARYRYKCEIYRRGEAYGGQDAGL
jgi:hypothetical protein